MLKSGGSCPARANGSTAEFLLPPQPPLGESTLKTLLTILIAISIVALCLGNPPAGIMGFVVAAFALFFSKQLAEKQQWRRPAMYSRR